ncbi:hypothetical protein [Pseudomonas sp. MYb185]|uniref:hypothetical protein n=1 Tax=Pseudomonas sp. MYb185 TaxID=1848729 RepID=UPI0011B07E3A|nr:hypothetical protein [Pseudomonas sp. MYb185]
MKRQRTQAWLMICLVAFSLPTSAGSLFRAAELSDTELAQLRGRYVLPGRIIHFGVTMSSIWENSAGQSIGAGVSFQVDGQAQPSLHVTDLSSMINDAGDGSVQRPGAGQVIGGAGLTEVRGISQSVRSAGDFNDGLNNLEIVISHGGEGLASTPGASPWEGTADFAGAAGNLLVSTQGGGLSIRIDAGTQGAALQQIGAGKIVQQANFTGDMNTVRNLATLNVALREMPLGQGFANCTLEQLRALRPVGY